MWSSLYQQRPTAAAGGIFKRGDWQYWEPLDGDRLRLDTEFYDGKPPKIWIGAAGPRMLGITGREADGWWP